MSAGDLAKSKSSPEVTVFEGIPCHFYEPEKTAQELGRDNILVIGQSGFYSPSYKATPHLLDILVSLKLQKNEGISQENGFHPDYLIQWGKGNKTVKVFVCLQRRAVKTTTRSGSVMSSISRADASRLEKALASYHQERP